jgi:tRNA(fMet)-specific endonuclease VapC
MYLLDTNICIFYIKGNFNLYNKIDIEIGLENCAISELTIAEMRYGAENSERITENRAVIDAFQERIQILPIFPAFDLYAKEKARLKRLGTSIHDIDLLITCTGIVHNMTVVTNNTKHFERINGILLEY